MKIILYALAFSFTSDLTLAQPLDTINRVSLAVSAPSKDSLLSGFKPGRIYSEEIDGKTLLLVHKRGSGIIRYEYYIYIKENDSYIIRWYHLSDKELEIKKLESGKVLIVKERDILWGLKFGGDQSR